MMGCLYSWATKEYILWNMTIGQVFMYVNRGIEFKYPKPTDKNRDYEEVAAARDELREMFPELRERYGDIDGDAR